MAPLGNFGSPLNNKMAAPNQIEAVRRVLYNYPNIDPLSDSDRGKIVDLVVFKLGGAPWGRKSKNKEGTDLSSDTLTYRFDNGKFEIIDILSGSPQLNREDYATWQTDGKQWNQGENGYWVGYSFTIPSPPSSNQLTEAEKEFIFKSIGVIGAKLFGGTAEDAAQGVRQGFDQNHFSAESLLIASWARRETATSKEVEDYMAAAKLLREKK